MKLSELQPGTKVGKPIAEFIRTWHQLAAAGRCDVFGGAECQRVFDDWQLAGEPIPCAKFILWRANVGPQESRPYLEPIARQLLTLVSAMQARADQIFAGARAAADGQAEVDSQFATVRASIEAMVK